MLYTNNCNRKFKEEIPTFQTIGDSNFSLESVKDFNSKYLFPSNQSLSIPLGGTMRHGTTYHVLRQEAMSWQN